MKEGGRARRGERKNGRVGEREADDFVINQKIDGSCFKRIKSVSNQKKKERKKERKRKKRGGGKKKKKKKKKRRKRDDQRTIQGRERLRDVARR